MRTINDSSDFYRKALKHVPYVALSPELKKRFPSYAYHLRIEDLVQFDYSPSTNITDISLNSKGVLDHIRVEPQEMYSPYEYTTINSIEFIARYEQRKSRDSNSIIQDMNIMRFEYTPNRDFCNCSSYKAYECNEPQSHSHFSLIINGKLKQSQKTFIRNTYRSLLEDYPSAPYFIEKSPAFPYSLA
jgi:hypothetical protein